MKFNTIADKNATNSSAIHSAGGGLTTMITNNLTPNVSAYKNNYNAALNTTSKANPALQQETNQKTAQDTVNISAEAKTAQRAVMATKGTDQGLRTETTKPVSETDRTEKVQSVASQVQNGTYSISPAKVASAMMRNIISEIG